MRIEDKCVIIMSAAALVGGTIGSIVSMIRYKSHYVLYSNIFNDTFNQGCEGFLYGAALGGLFPVTVFAGLRALPVYLQQRMG